jgi:hypothetical protein
MPPARHHGLILYSLATFVVEMVGEGFQRNRQQKTRRPLLLSHIGYSQRDQEQGRLSAVMMPPGTSAPYNFSRRDDEGDHQ